MVDCVVGQRRGERGIATITLDVPEKLNRVSMLARAHLAALFEACRRDPEARVVVMRGRRMGAEEALAVGLVCEVVPRSELGAAVDRLVAELAALPSLALRMAKRVINHGYDGLLPVGLGLEGLAYGFLRTTDDFREGVEAFVEKRKPNHTGQ